MYDLIVVGAGAAGVFGALCAKKANPKASILLLEKTMVPLAKVRVSGGGRCNVTHACFDPSILIKNYPRGGKELLGPFHTFQPKDTIEWFESRGVPLKVEEDGRIFPVSNRSESIIWCLLEEAKRLNIEISLRQHLEHVQKTNEGFELRLREGESLRTKNLLLATGSSAQGFEWAKELGHTLHFPVPSLFTFNVPTSPLKDLSGIVVEPVTMTLKETSHCQTGPLLITHFGFSGPAALKLSAWSARYLYEKNYKAPLLINWLPTFSEEALFQKLLTLKEKFPQKLLVSENVFFLPKNLWKKFLQPVEEKKLKDISHKELRMLLHLLQKDEYFVEGKTTNKEEFVTCGGIPLSEVNFKRMESKKCSGLFFAGEILDIDGVTGGFNFQNAWTTGFIAGFASMQSF